MSTDWKHLRSVVAGSLEGRRALVVGDVMLDRYVVGDVARISPEAPVPIVRLLDEHSTPGGAGNVAANLAQLGLQVTLAGWVGDDPESGELANLLDGVGVQTELLSAVPGRNTTTKTRVMARRQQLVRYDNETTGSLPAEARASFDARLTERIDASVDVVVLSDYAKGVLDGPLCRAVSDRARQLEIPVLVDPKGLDFERYAGSSCLTPNAAELAAACRLDRPTLTELVEHAEALRGQLALRALVVTWGELGMMVLDADGVHEIPAHAREVYDVSGAGDTVIATLAACAAAGVGWRDGAAVANVAAGLTVSRAGAVTVPRDDLLDAIEAEETGVSTLRQKVCDLDTARALVARWRQSGAVVGFTNGCFDLLHAGHVSYLDWAHRRCDRLVVGVNTDASVRDQKGADRPLVSEQERATVLAGLASVDAVVLFDEPTPIELIRALRPDLLVKGGDYDVDQIVGATEVRGWGGEVLAAPLVEGESTSNLVARARDVGAAP